MNWTETEWVRCFELSKSLIFVSNELMFAEFSNWDCLPHSTLPTQRKEEKIVNRSTSAHQSDFFVSYHIWESHFNHVNLSIFERKKKDVNTSIFRVLCFTPLNLIISCRRSRLTLTLIARSLVDSSNRRTLKGERRKNLEKKVDFTIPQQNSLQSLDNRRVFKSR